MSMGEKIDNLLCHWAKDPGEQGDVVISSRVRLARNLRSMPFPQHASNAQLANILDQVLQAVAQPVSQLRALRLEDLSQLDLLTLVEKNLISPQHAEHPKHRAVLLRADEAVSVMVNEEDHLRIQTILPGFQPAAAWRLADEVDDFFEGQLQYAFDERKGYLTACPTNVGTGMRVSVMLHLPALILVDQARKILSALAHLGFNVRGLYGEGSESYGGLFQVSNQVTLGLAEEEIVNKLFSATRQVIDHERAAREGLLRDAKAALEDRVWRAYGLLANSRLLGSEEALRLLSDLKLGIEIGLIPKPSAQIAKELMLLTRPGLLQKAIGKNLETGERDYYRAVMVRERLGSAKIG